MSSEVNTRILSSSELDKNVRNEAYKLPNGFVWSTIDPGNNDELTELESFLGKYYVEDKTGTQRLRYSAEFLKWLVRTVYITNIGVFFTQIFLNLRGKSILNLVNRVVMIMIQVSK